MAQQEVAERGTHVRDDMPIQQKREEYGIELKFADHAKATERWSPEFEGQF